MCITSVYGIGCEQSNPINIVVSATGNHQCLVFNNVVEFTSQPIEFGFEKWRNKSFRNTINLFISPDKIRRWVKFLYKTIHLNKAVFVFDIDGVAWSIDGKNISHNLHTSATEGKGYVLELIFNEDNMEVCS
jgi:hypothetical protein